MTTFHDENNVYFMKEISKLALQKGEGKIDYQWAKPGFEKPEPRVTYIKYFREIYNSISLSELKEYSNKFHGYYKLD
jgi:hypothetical protein